MENSEKGPEKKIVLPSSGLADDILASVGMAGTDTADETEYFPEDLTEEAEETEQESLHLVGFSLGKEEYALDISQVQEIIRVSGWTRVPNAPGYIKGVINLRGRIIPVVDPRVRMGSASAEISKDSRIIVVEAGRKVIGMLVDDVSQVMRLPLSTIEAAPDEVSDTDKGFVKGVGKLGNRLILLLALDKVLGRE